MVAVTNRHPTEKRKWGHSTSYENQNVPSFASDTLTILFSSSAETPLLTGDSHNGNC